MKKRIFVIVFIFLIIILGVGFVIASKPDKMTDAEKQKAIEEIMGRKTNLNPEIKTGETHFQGKYAEFDYPAASKIYNYKSEGMKNNKSIVESFSFDLMSPKRIFNYTVAKQVEGMMLDDVSAIRFRSDSSNGYTKKEIELDGESGLSFTKDKSGEYMAENTIFILRNGNLYTFSITSSSLDDANKLYEEISKSVNFL